MNSLLLTLFVTFSVILQYLLEHFIQKKRLKRYIGFFILLFAMGGIWGSYYQQKQETDSIAKNLAEIKSQNDTLRMQVGVIQVGVTQIDNRNVALKRIQAQNDTLKQKVANMSAVSPKLDPSGRIQLSPYVTLASEFETNSNEARNLFRAGKLDEAYKLAESLSRKNSSFGLAYFIMGTVEVEKGDYFRGEQNLQNAIKLSLTKDDEAWAYHNLAIASIRQRKFDAAIPLLEKCLLANPNMSESKQLLEQLKRR